MTTNRLAVLMTVHNRRETTLAALRGLMSQIGLYGTHLRVFLVDDGSDDGTADAVRSEFPQVVVDVQPKGHLFWAAGMARAEGLAAQHDPDYYLWLNDDTMLMPDAVSRLVALELARLRTGPVLGESAERAQLRTRISRWEGRRKSETPGTRAMDPAEMPAPAPCSNAEREGELCAILRNARDSELKSGCFSSDWCVQRRGAP